MADKKISQLTALSPVADDDLVVVVDISDTTQAATGTTKKALKSELKGDKGDTGTAATADAGTTTTGDAGTDASVVNSGSTSAAVFDFTIPRGDKGDKGDKGDQGDKGDKGDQGIQGIQGEQGIQGVQGIPGADGLSCVWKGAWLTATEYELQDIVENGGSSYVCVEVHTSGTFATDLSAGKWELCAQKGADGTGIGDMLASVYDPTSVEADAFDMDNMVEGTTNKLYTATIASRLANTSGTNTGDQESSDFDIKDLTDSTSLRSTWSGKQDALGFTPEDVSNKETSALDTSTTKYPCNNIVKSAVDGKMANPMTASGDIIYGGTSGTPTALTKGTDGQVLTLASGIPSWADTSGGGSNFAVDPSIGGYLNYSTEFICATNTVYNFYRSGTLSVGLSYGGFTKLKWNDPNNFAYKSLLSINGISGTSVLIFTDVKRLLLKSSIALKNGVGDYGRVFFGFAPVADAEFYSSQTSSAYRRVGFVLDYQNNKIYAVNSNGTNYNSTDVTVTFRKLSREFTIDFNKDDSEIKYYIDGTLVATHTTYIPTGNYNCYAGFGQSHVGLEICISPFVISQKQK